MFAAISRASYSFPSVRHPPSSSSSFAAPFSPHPPPANSTSMFNVFNLLAVGLAATAVLALPAVKRTSPSCDGLGGGAFDRVNSFTFAAYNTSLPNANTTGVPLVLGQAGAISGLELKVLSVRVQQKAFTWRCADTAAWMAQTFASFAFNQYPTIALEEGRLIPKGMGVTPAKGASVLDGSEVAFTASNSVDPTTGAQIYCGVVRLPFLPKHVLSFSTRFPSSSSHHSSFAGRHGPVGPRHRPPVPRGQR